MKKVDSKDNIKIINTCLISNRKASPILKYCKDNGIETVEEFLDFYYERGVIGNRKLEIAGLVDLLNFKYFKIVNEDFLFVLNSKLVKNDLSFGFDKVRLREDLALLKRLGLTILEIKSFYYFSVNYKNKKIIELINEFIKPTSHHIYLGAYLESIFMNKMNLICEYYNSKSKINDDGNARVMGEINILLKRREEILNLKSAYIDKIKKLNIKIDSLNEDMKLVDSMVKEKKKSLQNI